MQRGKKFYPSAKSALENVHQDVVSKYFGCGNPIPEALDGANVVDLGSGSGRDVYICSQLVGPNGSVIGVDMTPSQLETAESYIKYHEEKFGYSNVKFSLGFIESFVDNNIVSPVQADLVISNCVICLSEDKPKVFQQAWDALKNGGELYFSDLYSDRRIPESVRNDKLMWNEGFGGSLYIQDFRRIMNKIGFKHLQIVNHREYTESKAFKLNQNYWSITFRCIKLESLEDLCEDYQIEATYNGGIQDFEDSFEFDINYTFEKGKPTPVCLNTAEILRHSRYSKYFTVSENGVHQGLFSIQNDFSCLSSKPVCAGNSCE